MLCRHGLDPDTHLCVDCNPLPDDRCERCSALTCTHYPRTLLDRRVIADLERRLADVERQRDELRALARALVDALPRCDACGRPATQAERRGAERYCDEHAPEWYPESADYPRAAPLRALVAALGLTNSARAPKC